jgi:putative hemolysin
MFDDDAAQRLVTDAQSIRPDAGTATQHPAHNLTVAWARHADEVREAQRLRYKVFVEEMGAQIKTLEPGLDIDLFDPYCDHLLVRDAEGRLIGTYRALPAHQAKRVGTLYTETEFDLTRLHHLKPRLLEIGRSCVHRDYRNGAVILALWRGIAVYMQRQGLDALIGCASMSMHCGGHTAASLWAQLQRTHLADIEDRVHPRLPLPIDRLRHDLAVEPPALLKGYLRVGAKVCGAPAWDPDFGVADFPVLLRLSQVNRRYARHFLGE